MSLKILPGTCYFTSLLKETVMMPLSHEKEAQIYNIFTRLSQLFSLGSYTYRHHDVGHTYFVSAVMIEARLSTSYTFRVRCKISFIGAEKSAAP